MKFFISQYSLINLTILMKLHALENIEFNTMVQGETLRIIPDISFNDCWTFCEQRPACGSIIYQHRLKICYLNCVEQLIETIMHPGVVFRQKSDQSDVIQCGIHFCTRGMVCDRLSEQCNIQECSPLQEEYGVNILGNKVSIGSKQILRCRNGFIPKRGNVLFMETVCDQNGWTNVKLECVPLTCKGLADNGIVITNLYKAYDEGSKGIILIFCEFTNGSKIGYSFLSQATLTSFVDITPHYNLKDHIMLRYDRNGMQYETKMEVIPLYRDKYNVSVFNSHNPDFSGPIDVSKPYLYLGFIPISYGNHSGILKGYACNWMNYVYRNADSNPSNFFAIFHSKNTTIHMCHETNVRDGWKKCSRSVSDTRFIPNEIMFNSYEIEMGGGGCLIRNDDDKINGLTFGLPFDY